MTVRVCVVQDVDATLVRKAALAVSMLLLLKQNLKKAHALSTERITAFSPGPYLSSAYSHACKARILHQIMCGM